MLGWFRKIAFKLAVLAGIPVIGALLLALEIASGARERARTAEAIGSIEDLAELSARMTDTVNELQSERAWAALSLGLGSAEASDSSARQRAQAELVAQEAKTDAAVHSMDVFLSQRDLARLPVRLGGDLARARAAIERTRSSRASISTGAVTISDLFGHYGEINAALIDATAALIRLSEDGALLRALSSLVAVMQVQECESREHALLNYTFARGEFAPGLFRELVTLTTEQAVRVASLESFATSDQVAAYSRVMQLPGAVRATEMLKKVLALSEDDFGIAASDWFEAQRSLVNSLAAIERAHADRVRQIANDKVSQSRRAVRYSEGLAVGVVLVSLLLTVVIGRRITRSVLSLATVAGNVQREKDYSLRAVQTSADELGTLTNAFNEMLEGIQNRDRELSSHRENLERLVSERTAALSKRNDDMRLVLDTVEQGLVTVDQQGVILPERSRAFDTFFGSPPENARYFAHLAGSDDGLAAMLELDWAQIVEGVLPLDLAVEQANRSLQSGSDHFALRYKPIADGEQVKGALLTVSNITSEIRARRAEAEQREQVKAFARVMQDKAGFLQFFEEAQRLLERIRKHDFASQAEQLRIIHTLKGNAALFEVASVAEAAHALEQAIVEHPPAEPAIAAAHPATRSLVAAWDAFAQGMAPVLGKVSEDQCEVSRAELKEMLQAVSERRSADLERLVQRLELEPIRRRLERISQQLSQCARRLHKGEPLIVISGANIRLPPRRFEPFWSAFAHVVRNIADHGLESAEERERAGKSPRNKVTLSAALQQGALLLEVTDDGRGIDWRAVAERAQARGIPYASRADLVEAIFTPGLSTSDGVSETSGRGVGMSAVREVCRELAGDCLVASEAGQGTKLTFRLSLGLE